MTAQDLLGRRFDDFLEPGLDLETAWRSFLQSGEQAGELQVIRLDGEVRDVEYSATARFVAGRHLAILRDIASRKRGRLNEQSCDSVSSYAYARRRRCSR